MNASADKLRFRQVHLDFHTSEHIDGIGAAFDPDEFADTLKRAHVDSVTAFARCHHGYIYYPSKRNPERIHPRLKRPNLLSEQIEACHKRGIRVPVYTTVQWDQYTAHEHRDWLVVDEDGKLPGTPPLDPGFYRFVDVFHPGYRQFLKDHVKEMFETLPAVDGLFFDIVQPRYSLAKHWLDAMDNVGVNPEDAEARQRFANGIIDAWKLEMTEYIRTFDKDCTIFYNAGHIGPRHKSSLPAYTHYELESLPSGGWGYLHFPLTMRYARGLDATGHPCLGMTGKFHTSWGDFHSYKNEAALQFECFQMIAMGARCSIGDQLPPDGKIDEATYDLIGKVYSSVERKEPWCENVTPLNEVGLFTPEQFQSATGHSRLPEAAMGAVRMLQEAHIQFDIIDTDRDFNAYKLLILPDEIPVDETFAKKLEQYLDQGGALILSHRAGLAPAGDRFASDRFGVSLMQEAPYSPDFIVPGEALNADLPRTGHVMYQRALEVRPADNAAVLADVETPHFNRTWRHFCSHAHAPSSGQVGYPGIVQHDRVIYFAHPLFRQYQANAPRWCRKLLEAAIDRLMPDRLVRTTGPTTLLTTLNHQPDHDRYILHLLHYLPERRGQAFDIIEDIIPLHAIDIRVKVPGKVGSVALVPDGDRVEFHTDGKEVRFTVPKIVGHAMVEIDLA
ncbi:beta-galactosidase trimerization domain-containing protein [Phycisphaerales bacterium AB-hyl4]|uniref:Beta-galactosidase trimerization domain-containing protein n=1 Tax=Natronomicrosphaera hydrolytica TaxID=3242702 RepID=A0ABV4U6N5_9BACT